MATHDPVFHELVAEILAESETMWMNLTLVVDGQTISGTAVSRSERIKLIDEGVPKHSKLIVEPFEKHSAVDADDSVYLRDPVHLSGQGWAFQKTVLRVRLDRVSAWAFGAIDAADTSTVRNGPAR